MMRSRWVLYAPSIHERGRTESKKSRVHAFLHPMHLASTRSLVRYARTHLEHASWGQNPHVTRDRPRDRPLEYASQHIGHSSRASMSNGQTGPRAPLHTTRRRPHYVVQRTSRRRPRDP
jgi:hypothetical protein